MSTLLYIEFPSDGPFGAEAATAYASLADDITAEPGLVWKVWTEQPEARAAGGVYLFEDRESAARFAEKHTARLAGFGITDIKVKEYMVNEELSRTTGADLG